MAANPSPFPTLRMDLFSQLPTELRLKIFSFTNLIPIDHSGRKAGLHIADGEPSDPPAHFMYWHSRPNRCDCPAPFPITLLDRPNPYYAEVLETAFSHNRLVFSESPALALTFLQTHSQGLQYIRALEFQFDIDLIEQWIIPQGASPLQLEWQDLVTFIRQNLNLSNLTLSLNAGVSTPIYEERCMVDRDQGDSRLQAYKKIVEPLRGMGQMVKKGEETKRLKAFYVFWACYHYHEAEAEREVMGEGYVAPGKVPWEKREASDPWWDGWEEREEERKRKRKEQEKEKELQKGESRHMMGGFQQEDYGDSPWGT